MREAIAHKFPHGIADANSRAPAAVDDPANAAADHSSHADRARHLVFADHAAGHRLPVGHAGGDVERDHRGPQHRD